MLQRGVELATLDASWLVAIILKSFITIFYFHRLGYHLFHGMLSIYLVNVVLTIYFSEKIMQPIKQK